MVVRRLLGVLALVIGTTALPAALVPPGAGAATSTGTRPALAAVAEPVPAGVVPVPAKRILDTRTGIGAPAGSVPAGGVVVLQVTGRGGVPADGVQAAFLTLTVTGATGDGYVTTYPAGRAEPLASTVNVTAGTTVANLALVALSPDGKVALRFHSGGGRTAHLVADVTGYVTSGPATDPGALTSLAPTRILDTRRALGAPAGPVAGGTTVHLQVTGTGGVPAGAGSVALNVTVTGSTRTGYVTVAPGGTAASGTSTLNFAAGGTVANLALTSLSPDGAVDLTVAGGPTQLIVDVTGYAAPGTPTGDGALATVTPNRVLDTRAGPGAGPLSAGQRRTVTVTGAGGIPASGVAAVALNLTATDVTSPAVVTAVAGGAGLPGTSNLNVLTGRTVADLVLAPVSATGTVDLAVLSGGTDLIADVTGYVLGPPADTTPPAPVTDLTASASGRQGIALSWTPSPDASAVGVMIRRAAGTAAPAGPEAGVLVAVLDTATTAFTDSGLPADSLYSYAAFAFDDTPNYASPSAVSTATAPVVWTVAESDAWKGSPADVSCPSPTWCMAVDGAGDARTFTGSSRGSPVRVTQPTLDGGFRGGDGLRSVSCTSTDFCLASGQNGVFVYRSGTWSTLAGDSAQFGEVECSSPTMCLLVERGSSRTARFDGTSITTARASTGLFAIDSMSCVSTTFCMATGETNTAVVKVLRWDGSTWHQMTASTGGAEILSLSCPSTQFCLAVTSWAGYLTFNGTSWSSAHGYSTTAFNPVQVSCTASTFCWAVGQDYSWGSWNGHGWSLHLTDHLVAGNDYALLAMDCGAPSLCVVTDTFGRYARYSNGSRSIPTFFDRSSGGISAVSCPTPTFCMTSDYNGSVERFTGTAWTTPSWPWDRYTVVSCASGSSCLGVSADAVWRSWNGTAWSASHGAPSDFLDQQLSCVDSAWCMGLDYLGTAERFTGAGWSSTTYRVLPGGSAFNRLSCTGRTFCMAVDQNLVWSRWNGSSWTTPRGMTGLPLSDYDQVKLSCSGPSLCVATAREGTWVFTGASWRQLRNPGFYDAPAAVACTRAGFCTAFDGQGDRWTYDGHEWAPSASRPDIVSVDYAACPSTTRCVVANRTTTAWSS